MTNANGWRLTGQGLWDLLVDDHVYHDSPFRGGFEHGIEAVFGILSRRPAQVQLGTASVRQ